MIVKTLMALSVLGLIQYLMSGKAPMGFIVLLDLIVLAKVFAPKRDDVVGHTSFCWVGNRLITPAREMIKRSRQARKAVKPKKPLKIENRRSSMRKSETVAKSA